MKKFDIPVMEVAKFDADDVVTTSGTTWENSTTKQWAESRLGNDYGVKSTDIFTFTF